MMIKDFKIQRCITFYEKNGDSFIGDKVLLEEEITLEELKEVFEASKKDPLLYEQYDIDKRLAAFLSKKIKFDFQFDKFDYFLETFNVDVNTKTGEGIRLRDH